MPTADTTSAPQRGHQAQGNPIRATRHTQDQENKPTHSKSSKREERRRQCQRQGRGQKDWSWINGKATGLVLSFNRPMSGLASQGARVSPRTERPWTKPGYKGPQAQRRSNGSQGIPEASDLGARVRRCTKQCPAHTQLLLDNKISDESICLAVGMVKAWMKHNQGRGKIL